MSPALILRATLVLAWVFSPPLLCVLAIRRSLPRSSSTTVRRVLAPVLAVLIFADWVAFVVTFFRGNIGGFGSHYLTTRSADSFLIASLGLVVMSPAAGLARGKLKVASFLVFALWFGSAIVA